MKFIADLHIHSHYSISTSKKLIPEYLDLWAGIKGIKVVGTGDFTHPGWISELQDKLLPAEEGLFRLKQELKIDQDSPIPKEEEVRFLLSAEISTIYKRDDRVRKVHHLILVPGFEDALAIQRQLAKIGNITSDGRPILGLDSRDLLEIVLEASERALFIPAHIWTPWFSSLGAKSGFDSIRECYRDLSEHIFAVETGLSSDPPMNWLCSFLDQYTLISNSDAHSPEKLGREANILDTALSYEGVIKAIKGGSSAGFGGTIEFFPQEGKYHYDGHRKCAVSWDPLQTLKHNGLCPVCGKKVTVGVMNRVAQLADRDALPEKGTRPPFFSLVPLKEILAEIAGVGPQSKRVAAAYNGLIEKEVTELDLLLHLPISRVKETGGELLAEGIRRMRNREVLIQEGFDGEYGRIKVLPWATREEGTAMGSQGMLFAQTQPGAQATAAQQTGARQQRDVLINFDFNEFKRRYRAAKSQPGNNENNRSNSRERKKIDFKELNPEQKRAVGHCSGPALVIAGPGTGKTHTLTLRIAHLILNYNINPENILAVTFTNKAAGEMSKRLKLLFKNTQPSPWPINISTFHAFGFSMLKENSKSIGRENNFSILDEEDKQRILKKVKELDAGNSGKISELSSAVTNIKQGFTNPEQIEDSQLRDLFLEYSHVLKEENAVDLDDLIYLPVQVFKENPPLLEEYRRRIKYLLIDEFQDINLAQYQLIRMLMPGPESNIYAIGDPNQAIYGFRGADVRLMDQFIRDYSQTVRYRLNTSYRCSDYILKASSRVIDKSLKRPVLKALNRGVKITITGSSSEKSEAEFIARTIEKMIGGLRFFSIDSQITQGTEYREISSLSDFAVLVRISRQMEPLEKAFRDHSIPYQRVGELPFFKEEPVKSILDLLKMVKNSRNSLLKEELISRYKLKEGEIRECRALINQPNQQLPVSIILNKIIDTWFIEDKIQNKDKLTELIELADSFSCNLQEFMKFIALGGELAGYKAGAEKVSLLTLHAAKGLEFKCVFLAGCEQGLLPYAIFKNSQPDPDEERRLFYVGMTRAVRFLFLTHARRRLIFNQLYQLEKSPFLADIEKELAEFIDVEHKKNKPGHTGQLELFS